MYLIHISKLTFCYYAFLFDYSFLSFNYVIDLFLDRNCIIRVYNRKYGQFYESDPDTPGDAAETFKKAVTMSLGDIFKETTGSTSDDRAKFEEVGLKRKKNENVEFYGLEL